MSTLEPRPVQTRVKHEILQAYLEQWGYIVTQGLAGIYNRMAQSGRKMVTRFVYVDCFSYRGVYAPENGDEVYGSPLIGIESLQRLATSFKERNQVFPDVYAILVEEKKENYRILRDTLNKRGFGTHIREATDLRTLSPGDIAIINDDYTRHIDSILEFTNRDYTWSLYLLDPFGPKGLQLDVVSRIVTQERADVIINLMYQDLHKKSGFVKAASDPRQGPHENWDAVYGDQEWRRIAQRYYGGEIEKEDMESGLVELYKQVLSNQDPQLAVKRIPLKFEDKERTMFYLFLTTHDGTGALKMNEILGDAKISEYHQRQQVKTSKTQQLSMFDVEGMLEDPSRPRQMEFDLDEIAENIYRLCKGEAITFRTVLARLADTPYYLEQVRKAMTKLKKANRCSYGQLDNKSTIYFN